MSLGRALRGSIWLSLGAVLTSFFGLIYWLLITPMVSPEIVGRAATVLAIVGLLLSTLSLGIPTGVMRFLGREYSRRDTLMFGIYFYSSLIFILGLDILAGLLLLGLGLVGGIIPLDIESILFTSVLILLGWSSILASLFNSILAAEYVTLAQLITGLCRVLVGVPLVYLGLSFSGIMFGYVVAALINAFTLLLLAKRQLRRLGAKFSLTGYAIIESLKAGLATWIPSILALAGQWFGILGLSGFVGSYETGTYFIAFAITAGILSLPMNLLSLMFPVLSGMEDGRKRAMGRAVRIASAIMYPIIFILIAYPSLIPSLIGRAYLPASVPVMILAAGFLAAPLISGYTYYAYALAKYKHVVIIGLVENLPRLIFYPVLIREFSEIGAAVAFSLGFIFSLVAVIPLAERMGYNLDIKGTAKILAIPLILYLLILILAAPPIIGASLILALSYVSYARIRIISIEDLQEMSRELLSKKALAIISPYLKPILKIIYGEWA